MNRTIYSDAKFAVLLAALAVIFLLECYLYFLLPRIQYRSFAKMKDTENQYIFRDDVLQIVSINEMYNGEAEIEYALLTRVFETSKYFFLYHTNKQVFLVNKSTIEGGTAEDIRRILSAFVANKYIVCKY